MAINKSVPGTKNSTQNDVNWSFDEDFGVIATEGLVYNPSTCTVDKMVQPGTEAKQNDIITELQKKPDEATTPTVYNVTLTNANTEYSQALPVNTKELRFRCRTLYDVRFAWVTGKVATPTEPYLTLPAGSDYWSDRNDLSSQILFFASSTAGVVCELEVWT